MHASSGRCRYYPWLLLVVVLFGAGCRPESNAWPEPPELPRAEIVVDLTQVEERRVPISMVVEGVSGRNHYFSYKGPQGEYDLHEVRFEDGAGKAIPHIRTGSTFRLQEFTGSTVKAYWTMEPGGLGRHGHQGMVGEDWATFDGRMYLMPRGASDLRAARIRFNTPAGWSAGTPFREQDGWYYLDTLGEEVTYTQLKNACVGVGRFETRSRMMGEMEVRVSAYSGWSEQERERLFESTMNLMQRIHDELGFDLGAPYVVVWTPEWQGRRVYGGSHVNGTCLQNPDHRLRSFQLLAHRAAHSMNKYRPTGMKMLGAESSWFKEGWPSYIEHFAAEAAGLEDEPNYLSALYSTYLDASDDPELDRALIDEPSIDGDPMEYLHYTKGPLVVQMLDELIQRRTGNTLQHYMRQIWVEHRGFKEPYKIKETLEEMTGESLDAFWRSTVHERAQIVPGWEGFVTEQMQAAVRDTAAGRVGDALISVDYLYHLASVGEFASFAAIGEFLAEEEARRQQLHAADLQMCPDSLLPHLPVLPPVARLAVVNLERAQLPQPKKDHSLQFTPGDEIAVAKIGRLFDRDRDYHSQVVAGPIRAVEFTRGETADVPRLAFTTGGAVVIRIDWRGRARPAVLTLRSGQIELHRRTLSASEAGSAIKIAPLHRPLEEALIDVEFKVEGAAPVTRTFWQRDPPRTGRAMEMTAAERQDPMNWHSRAQVLVATKRFAEAIEALEHAIALAPDQPRFHFTMASTYMDIERFEEAISSFDEVLKINPAFAAAIGGRAEALAAIGEGEAALAAIETLMRDHESLSARFTWQGRVFEQLQRLDEALASYTRYTEAMPRKVDGWKQLGRVQLSLGRREQALASFKRGLELNPRDKELQQLSKRARIAVTGGSRRR